MKQSSFFLCMIIAIIAAMSFTSCSNSSASGNINDNRVQARVQEAYGSNYELVFPQVEIKWVNQYHKVGDLVQIAGNVYKILDIYYTGCPFEGLECPNAYSSLLEYQLLILEDSVFIYDKGRFVGEYRVDKNNKLDSILLADNL